MKIFPFILITLLFITQISLMITEQLDKRGMLSSIIMAMMYIIVIQTNTPKKE